MWSALRSYGLTRNVTVCRLWRAGLGRADMLLNWREWKRFPDPERGDHVEAPIGAGLYEVRHISSGALYAFGATDQVVVVDLLYPAVTLEPHRERP